MRKKADVLENLVALSNLYGNDPEFVIAGGGNTSVKIGESLFIKASGIPLGGITREGFVELDRRKVRATLTASYSNDVNEREEQVKNDLLAARVHPEKGARASVEAALHELVDYTFVVHLHAALVNGMTCGAEGEIIASELFGEEALWINYCNPGYTLARKTASAIARYRRDHGGNVPQIIFLENHGFVVGADQPSEVRDLITRLMDCLSQYITHHLPANPFGETTDAMVPPAETPALVAKLAPLLRGLLTMDGRAPVITFNGSEHVRAFVSSTVGRQVAKAGPFTPDQIVYCRSFPLFISQQKLRKGEAIDYLRREITHYRQRFNGFPRVVLVEGLGLFGIGENKNMADIASAGYADAIKVAKFSMAFGGPHTLTTREWRFIDSWEVESYRRRIATEGAGHPQGRVEGKVAIVTGAAQGFGEGIAHALADEGAYVVIADINEQKAAEVAEAIVREHGPGRALAVAADVTDEQSVQKMVDAVVREYGGIDILVSNAGVLRAGSVKTMTLADFEFVTRVNYTGYFLCVKHVSPVMARQHEANPDYHADIIQINSKSGLQGSNRNAAYAGSKFGGIGLTQSFALELVEDGIKVNSICPGNFFDGPLWSDPERGLFVQYLRSGKVPGARTIEDVRKAYEAKVPMQRGCTIEDVVRAILYVIEQQYETGQAIPVTGGQVMR